MSAARIEFVDVFTRTPGQGNRAGVVLDAHGLTTDAMQRRAAQSGVSETAFGLPSTRPEEYELEVRYFSRTRELPLCGHATIAFHYLRAHRLGLPSQELRVKTGAGILPITIQRAGAEVRVVMTLATPQIVATPSPAVGTNILAALGLSDADLVPDLPIQVVSTGHAKVLIPIRSYARLNALRPSRDLLLELSPLYGASGFFIFTLDRQQHDLLYHGRMFAPATGVDEDPVTGNAHGPAGYYLWIHGRLGTPCDGLTRYRAAQGEAMGRPGQVEVLLDVRDERQPCVRISGQAVIVEREQP